VLDNKPTGAPITMDPDTDKLIDPTTYLIFKNAFYNKATRAYPDNANQLDQTAGDYQGLEAI
jgi:hypothetical protein